MKKYTADALIDAYLDGTLAPEQEQPLQELLREDSEARSTLRRRAAIDEHLSDLAQGDAAVESIETSLPRRPIWKVVVPWGIAALLALGIYMDKFAPREASPAPEQRSLGLLVDEAGAVFEEDFSPNNGQLDTGEYRLTSGAIHFQMNNGAELLLRAPARFRIQDAFNLELFHGNLRAVIPPSAEGFTVAAPNVHYEDLGTEFGVSVEEGSGTSQIHVFDGLVNAKDAESKQLLSAVSTGQSMQLKGSEWKPAEAPRLTDYPEPGKIGYQRWVQWRDEAIRDPSLLAFYAFTHDTATPETLANDSGASSDGVIHGARWVSGRWPGKQALLFDRADDHVELDVSGAHDELTLSFWVKVDRLDHEYNALLNSKGWESGDLHFQIKRTGLAWANVNGKKASRPGYSGEAIERGRWLHIVGVVSRTEETIRTYVNGQLEWEQAFRLDGSIAPGACGLGNWVDIPEKWQPVQRAFKGRMDEVAIWSRALSEKEIKAHYQAGRPRLIEN